MVLSDPKALIARAVEISKFCHNPYGKKKCGAVLDTDIGPIQGVVVENCAYPSSVCACEAAVYSAISSGAKELKSMYIYIGSDHQEPCGRCVEVLDEFCGKDFKVVVKRLDEEPKAATLGIASKSYSTPFTRKEKIDYKLPEFFRKVIDDTSIIVDLTGVPLDGSIHQDLIKKLFRHAVHACNMSYAPISNFPVGAAVLTNDDQIVTGCNVEIQMSIGCGLCAERSAIVRAVSMGAKGIKAIAIVLAKSREGYASPCGACRQVIIEFGNVPTFRLNTDPENKKITCSPKHLKIEDLCVDPFSPKSLG